MLDKIRHWAAGVLAPAVQNTWTSADSQAFQDIAWWAPSYTGQPVTAQTSMRVSAVYACVRLLSGSIASLPLPVYERTPAGRKLLEDHPLWWILNEEPTPRFTSAAAWQYATKSVLLRGDAFMQIKRNAAGVVNGLIPLDPDFVVVERNDDRLVYYVQDGEKRYGLNQDDVLHLPGFGFNGLRSMSVIQWAAKQSIGIAMAAEEHSARFFSNGAQPSFILKTDGKMSPEQADRLKQQFAEKVAGTANAWKPFVLTEGVDLKEVSISAADAQLMEARKFQVIDIARAFGVPPFMIGEMEKTSSWGSGVEHMGMGFVKYTLKPYLVLWEQELNRKLFRTAKYFVKFDVADLLRGDSAALAAYYREAIGGSQGPGWMTANEVRHELDQLPVEDGDKLYNPNQAQGAKYGNAETTPAGN
jgi:HK97 family phage portal protein